MKNRLEDEASAAGRSLSEEIEARLEKSFDRAQSLEERLIDRYGRQSASVLLLIGRLLRSVPAAFQLSPEDEWLNDPGARLHGARAISYLAQELLARPGELDRSIPGGDGRDTAHSQLLALGDRGRNEVWSKWASDTREALGEIIAARIIEWRDQKVGADDAGGGA